MNEVIVVEANSAKKLTAEIKQELTPDKLNVRIQYQMAYNNGPHGTMIYSAMITWTRRPQ